MPAHSPALLAARPAPRCLVLLRPTGLLVAVALPLGGVLLAINTLKLAGGHWPWRSVLGELLSLALVLGGGYRAVRGNQPRLLAIAREALHLAPLKPGQNQPAETIALSSIVAYTYWLRLLRWRGFAQYHLRLELADGRVLHLADRPGPRPDDPTGTVRLDVLAKRLARRTKSGPLRRPLFYQTRTARGLLWASWGALAVALGLLGLGYSVGILLLPPAITYGCLYYLGRADADLTA
ncbi:hypothetical protein [Hymenobacter bucti]|uniref:Uncharacterized protein n=1 Tax=Hymenobacter bucti TaxID=1844114 RepID=A0ABW4QZ45_9BACT